VPRSVRFALNAMQKCNMPGLFSTHKSQTNLIITTWGAYVTRNRHKYLQGQLSFNRFLLLSIMKKFLHVLVPKKKKHFQRSQKHELIFEAAYYST
jgi:hypothetical protein